MASPKVVGSNMAGNPSVNIPTHTPGEYLSRNLDIKFYEKRLQHISLKFEIAK
jgi:hypothetical protein